ncbi:serine hydrolase [Lysobacter sp. TY2-98]|uniref:serine hydrolase n=1 Tax=Lysobacter sp. TY2-98 TaxID=2290922 RepID=UPI000E20C33E|nr:serine hydrolase [Lysobacter sp. TY2-98]AXK72069.1 serine hydrolase [Lysobacter sp. TY2-98]
MTPRLSACLLVLPLLLVAPVSAQETASAPTAATALPAQLADFDAYVESARKRFDVPGIAVAIVKDGHVVLEKGWGVRKMGTNEPVTAHTQFAIASNTKAFTSMAISMLADDGKLSLDDRVIDHLPWFRMSDPYITHEMRVRDLLAHRSGLSLGAGDLLYWPGTTYTGREVAERLKNVPINGSFRGQYAYDNILFGVAQLVVEQASGQSFQSFLDTRILGPLGMKETRYNSDFLKPGDEFATGHAALDFKDVRPLAAPMTWSNVAGAGGIYSSVHDMARWMDVQLAGGIISGSGDDAKRLVSDKRHDAQWQVVTPIPVSKPSVPQLEPLKPNFAGYGEGWFLSDYRGHKLVWHTGGWPGMVSKVTMIPDLGVGVVVLTNAEMGGAFNSITYRVLDAYTGASKTDWVAAYGAALDKSRGDADEGWKKHLAQREAASKPSLPLAKYAGTYRDPWYGDVVVERDAKGLRLRFTRTPELVGRLEHWQHDSFIVRWDQRWLNADAFVDFDLDHDGVIQGVRMQPVSPLTDFSFDFQDLRLAPVATP